MTTAANTLDEVCTSLSPYELLVTVPYSMLTSALLCELHLHTVQFFQELYIPSKPDHVPECRKGKITQKGMVSRTAGDCLA